MKSFPTRVSDSTHNNFLEAFWQLYICKSIDKIRVQDICDIAGYHRNSFYRYFRDIYDVREQIEDSIICQIIQQTDQSILCCRKDTILNNYLTIWQQNSEYLRVFAADSNGSHFQEKLCAALKQAHRKLFQYSSSDTVDDYLWEYTITGSVACMMYYYRREPSGLSLKEILELQFRFLDSDAFPLISQK